MKTNDPQIIVEAEVKQSPKAELIVFDIPLIFFEITCIVPIPEKTNKTKAYIKFRINPRGNQRTAEMLRSVVSALPGVEIVNRNQLGS